MCKKLIPFYILLLTTMPVYAVENFKISNYGDAHQIWFEAEDFDERNPDTDQYFPVVDEAGAFGQAITRAGDAGGMIRWTFNISAADGKGGTWYFWGRVINPSNQSDFMLVEGHPGDPQIPTGPPFPGTSSAEGFTNTHRVFEENTGPPWAWARSDHEEAHTKELQDGENTMYILHRQGNNTVFWDVFMWTDDADYVPTDEDYENAFPGVGVGPASRPDPADGALYADTWVSLSWRPGDFAVSHDVYLGENFDDVNDGTGETFQGNQPLTSTFFVAGFPGFAYPDGLVPGTTYYWRIDEVNDTDPNSPWKGPVWGFTVPPSTAYDPDPADGAKYVDLNVELSWTAGFGAKLHHVYFGDNFDDVNNAVVGLPQATTTYTPGTLEVDKTYYWRVDEFDALATHKGDVWSFSTVPIIPITDPNLIGWWTFDEGSGTTAVDYSGHNNHGTLMGDPQWVDGYDGGALDFGGDGDHVVDPDGAGYLNGLNALTVCMWIKSDVTGTDKGFINGEDPDGGDNVVTMRYDSDGSSFDGTNVLKMAVTSTPGGEQQLESSSNLQVTEWQHVAMTWSSGDLIRFYVNGVEDMPSGRNGPNNAGTVSGCTKLIIGKGAKDEGATAGWDGLIDDVRIYNKVLTADDIKQVMRGDTTRAWGPSPANGSTPDIEHATPLSWSPGENASQHDVYFGIDRDSVADADETDTTGIYRGRQGVTSYNPPEGVEWGGGPYYWRIDEYNNDATISKGIVWSFTVADFILVDDFEDYDVGNNEIWWVWIDGLGYASHPTLPPHPGNGTGSMVGDETTGSYMEETIVHGGGKSMPVFYDNNQQGKLRYSEVEKTLSYPRDWTVEGVGVLSLWFYGVASNAAESLYVALNGNAVVTHDNPNSAQIEAWTEWPINLQAFADQGVNLANVNTIAIGLGNKKNPIAGGSGTMYFDDIRLYRPAP